MSGKKTLDQYRTTEIESEHRQRNQKLFDLLSNELPYLEDKSEQKHSQKEQLDDLKDRFATLLDDPKVFLESERLLKNFIRQMISARSRPE